jgi:hypothetical protein
VYVVIRFWEPYTETGYTILIHGLIHILDYIRITILCYANIVMTAEVIANRGILNMMGWKQSSTVIEEDNSACLAAASVPHITPGTRHLDLAEHYLKEKTQDRTCLVVKVASVDNNADIGTKRVPLPLFNALTYKLVNRDKRKNL